MSKGRAFFMETEDGVYKLIPEKDPIKAIYYAWNYERPVYCSEDTRIPGRLVFHPFESNETNSDWLKSLSLKLIDHNKYRKLQSTKTGEVFEHTLV
ncbi:hypothetical protein [Bacillus subtilis]|uniref:hypothetical protein n=1 Tax=Bacillus subtilis TaxID=1423 RepID=UPI0025C9AB9E|nr:hypothetical protein [Bacillus subtilis]GLI90446.1 hypothetical protein ANABIO4_37980 [Bacillus subtilis]